MSIKRTKNLTPAQQVSTNLLNPTAVINRMVELRIQLAELEQQIQALQPAFQAACLTLNSPKIELERAVITQKLTPGQWAYSPEILQQSARLKQLKRQFQLDHEPIGGRDLTWVIKLLRPKSSS